MSPESTPEHPYERKPLSGRWRIVLKVIGVILVPIGVAGVILPVLPGVPVLILAAACFSRSSPRFERWLVNHPRFGPGIIAWRERGAIPRRAKILAISMMTISCFVVYTSGAPAFVKIPVLAGIMGAALFVVTRPLP